MCAEEGGNQRQSPGPACERLLPQPAPAAHTHRGRHPRAYESHHNHRAQPQAFLHCTLQTPQNIEEGCYEKGEGKVFLCLLVP